MKQIYNKKDVLNALRQYVNVLQGDTKREQNETTKQVLNNVIKSLSDIITGFDL